MVLDSAGDRDIQAGCRSFSHASLLHGLVCKNCSIVRIVRLFDCLQLASAGASEDGMGVSCFLLAVGEGLLLSAGVNADLGGAEAVATVCEG